MKNNIINPILILFILLCGLQSCDPQRYCNEPKCLYSDVNTEITGVLSGNLDSVIHIGDTIRFYMKIPDTMITNYGNVVFGNMLPNSFFGIQSGGGDTIIKGAFNGVSHSLDPFPIKFGTMPDGTTKTWDYNSREYECLFIPTETGKYYLNILGGRLEMKANDGKSWLINPNIKLDCPRRYNQYLSWMDTSLRAEAYSILSQRKSWYCFEVK